MDTEQLTGKNRVKEQKILELRAEEIIAQELASVLPTTDLSAVAPPLEAVRRFKAVGLIQPVEPLHRYSVEENGFQFYFTVVPREPASVDSITEAEDDKELVSNVVAQRRMNSPAVRIRIGSELRDIIDQYLTRLRTEVVLDTTLYQMFESASGCKVVMDQLHAHIQQFLTQQYGNAIDYFLAVNLSKQYMSLTVFGKPLEQVYMQNDGIFYTKVVPQSNDSRYYGKDYMVSLPGTDQLLRTTTVNTAWNADEASFYSARLLRLTEQQEALLQRAKQRMQNQPITAQVAVLKEQQSIAIIREKLRIEFSEIKDPSEQELHENQYRGYELDALHESCNLIMQQIAVGDSLDELANNTKHLSGSLRRKLEYFAFTRLQRFSHDWKDIELLENPKQLLKVLYQNILETHAQIENFQQTKAAGEGATDLTNSRKETLRTLCAQAYVLRYLITEQERFVEAPIGFMFDMPGVPSVDCIPIVRQRMLSRVVGANNSPLDLHDELFRFVTKYRDSHLQEIADAFNRKESVDTFLLRVYRIVDELFNKALLPESLEARMRKVLMVDCLSKLLAELEDRSSYNTDFDEKIRVTFGKARKVYRQFFSNWGFGLEWQNFAELGRWHDLDYKWFRKYYLAKALLKNILKYCNVYDNERYSYWKSIGVALDKSFEAEKEKRFNPKSKYFESKMIIQITEELNRLLVSQDLLRYFPELLSDSTV